MGIVISFTCIEIGIRVHYAQTKKKPAGKPAKKPPVVLNSLKMRDVEHTPEKPAGVFRILGLGDSFTHGEGIFFEKTYLKHLEYLLNTTGKNSEFEVIIYSRPGATTYEEKDFLEQGIKKYDPDLAIIGFCLNDAEYALDMKQLAEMKKVLRRKNFGRLEKKWYDIFKTVYFVRNRLEITRVNKGFVHFHKSLYDDNYKGWQVCKASLNNMAEQCQQHNIPLLLVIFPIFSHDMTLSKYPFLDIHQKLTTYAESIDIQVLDLFSAYEGYKRMELAIHVNDSHPNEKAHIIAGKIIYDKVCSLVDFFL